MRQEADMNADLLFRMACGFHHTGIYSAGLLQNSGTKPFTMIGPAAVNFALATELYLKAIHLLNKIRPSDTHELWKLFKTLPRITMELIEREYIQQLSTKPDLLKSIHMTVSRGAEDAQKEFPMSPDTVKKLLVRHNHSFISWRYLHEFTSKGCDYHFDFHEMDIFCTALNAHIIKLLSARIPHFGVTDVNTGEAV